MADPTTAPGFHERWRASSLTGGDVGTQVGSWTGANGLVLSQGTAAAQPILRTDASGRPYLEFDGVDDFLTTAAATFLNGKPGVSVYVVARLRSFLSSGFEYLVFCSTGAASGSVRFAMRVEPNKLAVGGRRLDADTFFSATATSTLSTTGLTALSAVGFYDGSAAPTDLAGYVNGSSVVSDVGWQADGLTSATNPLGLSVGGSPGGTGRLHMDLYEVLLFDAAHSDADRASVHTYVQDTYGVAMADYVAPPPPAGTSRLYLGSTAVSKLYLGSQPVSRLYLGSTLLLGEGAPVTVQNTSVGTGDLQWQFSSGWSTSTDEHYSSTTGATATLRFTGTSVALFAALDGHHGIANVSVDGGAAVPVDLYAASRVSGAQVWSSGLLTDGPHTVVVTVTGTRNASSGGFVVPIDYAEVVSTGQSAPPAPVSSLVIDEQWSASYTLTTGTRPWAMESSVGSGVVSGGTLKHSAYPDKYSRIYWTTKRIGGPGVPIVVRMRKRANQLASSSNDTVPSSSVWFRCPEDGVDQEDYKKTFSTEGTGTSVGPSSTIIRDGCATNGRMEVMAFDGVTPRKSDGRQDYVTYGSNYKRIDRGYTAGTWLTVTIRHEWVKTDTWRTRIWHTAGHDMTGTPSYDFTYFAPYQNKKGFFAFRTDFLDAEYDYVTVEELGATTASAELPRLSISGSDFITPSGGVVLLRGVNIMRDEYDPGRNAGFEQGAIPHLASDWQGNVVMRGFATSDFMNNTSGYRDRIDKIVEFCKLAGCYLVLAARSNFRDGVGEAYNQYEGIPPTSAEDGLAAAAARYKNESHVMFAAQVETNNHGGIPQPTWDQIHDYTIRCIDKIRAQGHPDVIVMSSGTNFGRGINGAAANPIERPNVAYKSHYYPEDRDPAGEFALWCQDAVDAGLCVFLGEFGDVGVSTLLSYADTHGLGWTAWLFEGSAPPPLLTSDDAPYTPNAYGTVVRDKLRAGAAPSA